jgi:hypothetical protein
MAEEKILSKLQKMLKIANDNKSHPEESQNALLKAQKLMAEHNLSMSDIGIEQEFKKEVVNGQVTIPKKLAWWYKQLSSIIGDNFRCQPYMSTYNGKTSIYFIGLKEDVEIAKNVYHFAASAIKFHSDKYVKEKQREGWLTQGVRVDFIKGYLSGLNDKFKEQVEKEGWGLILVKDNAVVEYIEEKMKFRKGTASSVRGAGDNEARKAGYEKGKAFSSPSGMIE